MIFTVDWEDWFMSIMPYEEWGNFNSNRFVDSTMLLLNILENYNIKAIWYISGYGVYSNPFGVKDIIDDGHILGSHGYYHRENEQENDESDRRTKKSIKKMYNIDIKHYRSPYWSTTPRPGLTGGFFFRILPYPIFKLLLKPTSIFWIHPWELDPDQPRIKVPLKYKRHYWGLKGVEEKLKRLLSEYTFDKPTS